MSVVRPKLLADTFSMAGYDHLDPITQYFLGGTATAGADSTGLNDDDRYGHDILNVGSGGKALRATSGDGTKQLRVDNTAVSITGLSVTGPVTFQSAVVMETILNVSGGVVLHSSLVVTGPATFGTTATVQGALQVDGNAVLGNGTGDTVTVAGDVTANRDVSIQRHLDVDGNAAFGSSTGLSVTLGDWVIGSR